MTKWRGQCPVNTWSKEKGLWGRHRSSDLAWGHGGAVTRSEQSTGSGVVRLRPLLEKSRTRLRNLDFSLLKALPSDHRVCMPAGDPAWFTPCIVSVAHCGVERGCSGTKVEPEQLGPC